MLRCLHPHTTLGSEGKLTSQDAQEIESCNLFGSLCYLVFWVHWLFVEGLRCGLFPHNFWFGFLSKTPSVFHFLYAVNCGREGKLNPQG